MASVNKHRKGRKRFFCFLSSCFGISGKVSADDCDGKLVKDVRDNSFGGKTVPANNQTPLLSTGQIISPSREIDEDKTILVLDPPPTHEVLINPKSKNLDELGEIARQMKDNNVGQKSWSKPTKLSHSVSLPLPPQKKEKPSEAAEDGGSEDENGNEIIIAIEFDSVVGAVILMVTLIVMLIWGKIYATLCTAAWFYFIPRFRAQTYQSYVIKHKYSRDRVDFDSLEYKKRVVLQGLLDRNQHL